MESSPSAMLKILLPRTPMILKTALAHSLNLSPTCSKWDLRTDLIIKIFRDLIGPNAKPLSISFQQRLTTKDPGVKGKVWISKVKFAVPGEDDVRQAVFGAIDEMSKECGLKDVAYERCEQKPLEAEWTGYRDGVSDAEPEPQDLTEKDKFDKLMGEVKSRVTVLYFHGGAMYLLDPATYRQHTSRIAKETGGRVFSVRYRLSPQNPFPAALLDALTAYLSLLHPPEGAPHAPVPANEVVFSGDSAGGMLCAALLQFLLHMHRSNPDKSKLPTLRFHGHDVQIPLPAGLALTSPWLDVTRSLPSIEALAHNDYLPPPSHTHHIHTQRPPCAAWPATPPRSEFYCEDTAMLHPLVSPLTAKDWSSAPPTFFSLGEEMLRDEVAVLAKRLHAQGSKVVWREFEAMPHCFGMMLEQGSALHFSETAQFCRDVVEGKIAESSGEFVVAKSLVRRHVSLDEVTGLMDDEVDEMMRKGQERIVARHGEAVGEVRPML